MAGHALAIAADPELAQAAAVKFLKGMRVASTIKAESAKTSLLSELVRACGSGDLLPLRPEALTVPLAAMKEAGYRAGAAYVMEWIPCQNGGLYHFGQKRDLAGQLLRAG